MDIHNAHHCNIIKEHKPIWCRKSKQNEQVKKINYRIHMWHRTPLSSFPSLKFFYFLFALIVYDFLIFFFVLGAFLSSLLHEYEIIVCTNNDATIGIANNNIGESIISLQISWKNDVGAAVSAAIVNLLALLVLSWNDDIASCRLVFVDNNDGNIILRCCLSFFGWFAFEVVVEAPFLLR